MRNNDNSFMWREELIEQHLNNHNYQELNIQDIFGDTGFMKACRIYPELAEIMLEKDDIDFNIQNEFGKTGFILACEKCPELVKEMLDNKKVDKKLRDKNGLTGYDVSQKYNPESFEVYQAWLAENEKNSIKSQVQKRTKKTSQHL